MLNILHEDYKLPESELVIDYINIIEHNLYKRPDKRTKEYKTWLKRMQTVMKKCNQVCKDQPRHREAIYTIIRK